MIWGVPIVKETERILEIINKDVEKDLTEKEKEIYQVGIYNALSALKVAIDITENEDIVVNRPDFDRVQEITKEELFEEDFCF